MINIEKNNKININVTVKNSVAKNEEFHFFVDELTSSDLMPTYQGIADEKYEFSEMNEKFFDFLHKKSMENGIFIRLVYVTLIDAQDEIIFKLEYGDSVEIFKTKEFEKIQKFEFADYGIKVKNNQITLGATVESNPKIAPYFAQFGSSDKFLSLNNPLNQRIIEIMENMIL